MSSGPGTSSEASPTGSYYDLGSLGDPVLNARATRTTPMSGGAPRGTPAQHDIGTARETPGAGSSGGETGGGEKDNLVKGGNLRGSSKIKDTDDDDWVCDLYPQTVSRPPVHGFCYSVLC